MNYDHAKGYSIGMKDLGGYRKVSSKLKIKKK